MPELPEVETTRNGIAPHILRRKVKAVIVRQRQLRWPVTEGLEAELAGQSIRRVGRRGKYLLLETGAGTVMIHLGMSGSLRIVSANSKEELAAPGKHDHVDIQFANGTVLRFHDPRRFGSVFWLTAAPESHPLLAGLGPEPLGEEFTGDYLYLKSRKRSSAIKTFIMDSRIVVGVGNIYANEALFLAGIDPRRKAGSVSHGRMEKLVAAIREILAQAIEVGGTTLRDFVGGDGKPGYFSQSLEVYGRGGEACNTCGKALRETRLGQRSTVFCGQCQS